MGDSRCRLCNLINYLIVRESKSGLFSKYRDGKAYFLSCFHINRLFYRVFNRFHEYVVFSFFVKSRGRISHGLLYREKRVPYVAGNILLTLGVNRMKSRGANLFVSFVVELNHEKLHF